jgi:hypothetical protein
MNFPLRNSKAVLAALLVLALASILAFSLPPTRERGYIPLPYWPLSFMSLLEQSTAAAAAQNSEADTPPRESSDF